MKKRLNYLLQNTLNIGHHPKSLTYKLGVDPAYLNDEGLYYTLLVIVPDGKTPKFPFS